MTKINTKKESIIQQIKDFESKYFNQDQKDIMIEIIKNAPFNKEQEYFDFLKMKRRTGFSFDYSPEVAKGRIITLREDVKRRINLGQKVDDNENKLIIGDNYNALKSLLITHKEKIDVIYIDPPYNTESAKNDGNQSYKSGSASKFNYKDKFGRGGWLNMMKQRLDLAKDLLNDEGVIFVSIDDKNQAYLKVLMDEIFGEENFITNIPRLTTPQRSGQEKYMNITHDYVIVYTKDTNFNKVINRDLSQVKILKNSIGHFIKGDTRAILASKSQGYSKGGDFDYKFNGKLYKPIDKNGRRNRWLWSKKRMEAAADLGILIETSSTLRMQLFLDKTFDVGTNKMIDSTENLSLHSSDFVKNKLYSNPAGKKDLNYLNLEFDYPKPLRLIETLINLKLNNKNAVVLDFFTGSGTTGHAVMQLNREDGGERKFILCTNNENNIADNVTYERLHRIIKGVGTKGETDFKWLEKNKPFDDVKLRVINIDDSVSITPDQINVDKIINDCQKGLKLLDNSYNKSKIELYYDLAAMNPLENEK